MTRAHYFIGAMAATAVLASGWASWGDERKTGTGIGAAGEDAVDVVIGHQTGSTARGAITGALVGGAGGSVIGDRMDTQAEKLSAELEAADVSRVGEGIAVTFDSGILFPFDSSELTAEARTSLRTLAASLRDEARTGVTIVGHTDSVGGDSYNQQLSHRRGRAALDYLVLEGVASSRLVNQGRGEVEPIASNETDDGRRANRRVEVAIYADREWRAEAAQISILPVTRTPPGTLTLVR
jgi:outer membrane protein OmpA-like peptidoglycan-associated protein